MKNMIFLQHSSHISGRPLENNIEYCEKYVDIFPKRVTE